MFFSNKTYVTETPFERRSPIGRASLAIASGFDIAIDFATLGEYRLVTDHVGREHAVASDAAAARAPDSWAAGIEWSSAPERSRAACSLPRARNRAWARSRIGG